MKTEGDFGSEGMSATLGMQAGINQIELEGPAATWTS